MGNMLTAAGFGWMFTIIFGATTLFLFFRNREKKQDLELLAEDSAADLEVLHMLNTQKVLDLFDSDERGLVVGSLNRMVRRHGILVNNYLDERLKS